MASATVGILRVLLSANTAEFTAAMADAERSMSSWQRSMNTMGQQAIAAGQLLTAAFTVPLAAIGVGATKAAMDFESSFANVGKTVDGVSDKAGNLTVAGEQLAQSFRNLAREIPATTDQLNQIAALGGQMGVPIEQLEVFTKNVAALGVAVDGISTEDAAQGLAQIGNASGEGTTKVAEMASALVHLGNNSAATEAQILEFTKRLIGAGQSAGLTVPEVMAIGTAMANVGINAEAGGTAMSTVITRIGVAVSEGGAKLAEFAKVAGMSAEQFAQTWRTSPIEAINAFIVGLGSMKERGVDLNLTMGEIGTEGIRVSDTLKRLAGASDGVAKSVAIANEGFAAGNKHLEEAEKKYATTANQLAVLWNRIKDIGITLGNAFLPILERAVGVIESLLPAVEFLANAFASLPVPVQAVIVVLGGALAAVGPLLIAFGGLVMAITPLLPVLAALVPTVAAVAAILSSLALPIAAVIAAIGLLTVAWIKWGEDIKSITVSAFEAVKMAVMSGLQFISNLWTQASASIVNTVSQMMQNIRQWLVTFWEGSIFQSIARMLQAMVELWVALQVRVLTEVTKLAVAVKTWLVDQLSTVIQSVQGLLAVLAVAYTTFRDAVVARVTETYNAVKSWLQDKLTPVFTAIRNFFQPVITAWTTAKDTVINLATALYTGVKTWLVDKFVDIVNGIKAKIDAVTNFFKQMKDAVVGNSYVPEMVTLIGVHIARLDGLMVQPVEGFTQDVQDMFAEMRDGVNNRMDALMRGVDAQTQRYPAVLTNPTQQASSITQTIFGAMSQGVQGIVGDLFNRVHGNTVNFGNMFTGTIGGISHSTQGIFSALSSAVQQIVGNMFNSLLGQAQSWGGMFMGILNSIIGAGITSLVSWGISQIGNLVNHFRGGEEGIAVNPARDQFLAQFGGSGTGPGSGFWELGVQLESAVGAAQAEALHAALRAADTMAEFNAAVSAINQALGGGGFTGSFSTGGTVLDPGSLNIVDTSLPSWVSQEAPEEEMGILEQMARGMADGGYGRVDRPTLFLAGEAGPEDYAFSGANKSFGSDMGNKLVFLVAPRDASADQLMRIVESELPVAVRMNRSSLMTRLQAALEIT